LLIKLEPSTRPPPSRSSPLRINGPPFPGPPALVPPLPGRNCCFFCPGSPAPLTCFFPPPWPRPFSQPPETPIRKNPPPPFCRPSPPKGAPPNFIFSPAPHKPPRVFRTRFPGPFLKTQDFPPVRFPPIWASWPPSHSSLFSRGLQKIVCFFFFSASLRFPPPRAPGGRGASPWPPSPPPAAPPPAPPPGPPLLCKPGSPPR